jgi:hypothetical protein
MMGERIGTDNPAWGTVNAFACWDWIDGAPLHHLRRESAFLIETDDSMKWHRWKKRPRA